MQKNKPNDMIICLNVKSGDNSPNRVDNAPLCIYNMTIIKLEIKTRDSCMRGGATKVIIGICRGMHFTTGCCFLQKEGEK